MPGRRSSGSDGGGSGIGLTIARGIVEAHHGQVTATSAGPGKGATFTVSGVQWRARERAVPLLDGAEWAAPVARV